MRDLIDRQDAIDAFDCTNELIVGGEANAQNVVNYINKVVGKIKNLPSAEPERKTGKWIKTQYPFEQCSICGAYFDTSNNEANYCCVCGAKMEEEE